jgi:peptidoglycan/LPS O-acetylase OafA/YrhL
MAVRSTAGPVPGGGSAAGSRSAGSGPGRPDGDLPAISGHQPVLDGLRVIAAFTVLVIHVGGETGFEFAGTPASWVVIHCDIGVALFFTLSGLLLFRPWVKAVLQGRPVPGTGTYLWRRAMRILPTYWIVVVIALITLNRTHIGSPATWIQYLALVQIYDPHPWWSGTGAPGLAQMWSLAVEVSFYVLLPLIAAVLAWYARRGDGVDARARRLLIGIGVFGGLSYVYLIAGYPGTVTWMGDLLPKLTTWFAPGMAMAVVSVWAHADSPATDGVRRFCRTIAFSGGTCWLIAGLAFAVACTPLAGPENIEISTVWQLEIRCVLYTVIAAAVVAPAAFQPARETRLSAVLGNPTMTFLGKISYSIFLWQFLVISALFSLFHISNVFEGGSFSVLGNVVALVAVSVATIALSTLSYYLIEEPGTRLRLRRSRGRRRSGDRTTAGRAARDSRPASADQEAGYADGRPAYAGLQSAFADGQPLYRDQRPSYADSDAPSGRSGHRMPGPGRPSRAPGGASRTHGGASGEDLPGWPAGGPSGTGPRGPGR